MTHHNPWCVQHEAACDLLKTNAWWAWALLGVGLIAGFRIILWIDGRLPAPKNPDVG